MSSVLLFLQFKAMLEADAAKTEEFKPYNILALDAPGFSDVILSSPEVCILI